MQLICLGRSERIEDSGGFVTPSDVSKWYRGYSTNHADSMKRTLESDERKERLMMNDENFMVGEHHTPARDLESMPWNGFGTMDATNGTPSVSPTTTVALNPPTATVAIPLVNPIRDCTPTNPCGRCEGDCDDDNQCEDDLVCFQKERGETGVHAVGGCLGDDTSRTDWCTLPEFVTSAPTTSQAPSTTTAPSHSPSTSMEPTQAPSVSSEPSQAPSLNPSQSPTTSVNPSQMPSNVPSTTTMPSQAPSTSTMPSGTPSTSVAPSQSPSTSSEPSQDPTISMVPSQAPTTSVAPSSVPTKSIEPSQSPSASPTMMPSVSTSPSQTPSVSPTMMPSVSTSPSQTPSASPTMAPSTSASPSQQPSASPTMMPSQSNVPTTPPTVPPPSILAGRGNDSGDGEPRVDDTPPQTGDVIPLIREVRDCSPDEPCGRCEGDCDRDDQCQGTLVCFQKGKGSRGEDSVGGCLGHDLSRTDWCTLAELIGRSDAPDNEIPLVKPVRNCTEANPCKRCEGDCDSDEQCEGSLICHQKGRGMRGVQAVPGCIGHDLSRTDWCTLPLYRSSGGGMFDFLFRDNDRHSMFLG
eukprot:CAMPEP_0194032074 /NCGR_PEP_ID=MMETSP0009_2-20130614/5103_1 /TAXON_ID=210454 /ORGANISM="Grammatophora oceanica, Strain CCMP 410" /LENGTH=578 /DNA_ID=CAMNT_0038672413 /DNA_START=262 /DNA_END=1998 /DNA_ORIENTATION=+